MRTIWSALILGSLACAFAAGQAKPAAATRSACAILSKAEVEKAIGGTIAKVTEKQKGPVIWECQFDTADMSRVDLMIKPSPVKYNVETEIAGLRKTMAGMPFKEVPGLGDRAVMIGGQLIVYRGNLCVILSLLGLPPNGAESLARLTLERWK